VQSQTAPEAAANLIIDQMPPGPAQIEAAISVVHQWGLQNFSAASDWVNQFPSGPLADRAKQELSGIAEYQHSLNH